MTDLAAAILEGIQQINAQLGRMEERQARAEARQERTEAWQERTDARLDRIEERQDRLEADLAHLRSAFAALPDFRLMMVRGEITLRKINEMEHALVDLKARLAEVYGGMATDAEINIFRDEMRAYRETALENEIRLSTLEKHILSRSEPVG